MCQSKAEGGQRCYSHANKEYTEAKSKYEEGEKRLHLSRLELQSIENTLERLDIAYELGEVDDEAYNRYQDVYINQRQEQRGIIKVQEKEVEKLNADVSQALNELRTTPTELAKLEESIRTETDPAKKHLLTFAYKQGNRLRNIRQQAFKRYKEGQERGEELARESKQKMEIAQSLPEYDHQTRQIKEEAILEAELLSAKAYLEVNSGREVFPALFDLQGNMVPAKVQKTKTGRAWGLLADPKDPSSKYKGFVTISQSKDPKKREEFYASKGYTIGKVWADGKAEIVNENGAKKVRILRNDGGFSPYAQVVTTNQYKETTQNQ